MILVVADTIETARVVRRVAGPGARVADATGAFASFDQVELPPAHVLLTATGCMLWTVSRDELDLPAITGWRPEWPGGRDWRN